MIEFIKTLIAKLFRMGADKLTESERQKRAEEARDRARQVEANSEVTYTKVSQEKKTARAKEYEEVENMDTNERVEHYKHKLDE